jgi:hypothetical protein
VLIILWMACACAPLPGQTPPLQPWTYADLRQLDPIDASSPLADITGVYLRQVGPELQIRLELAEVDVVPAYDLFLALDTAPGGARPMPGLGAQADLDWDALLAIPAGRPASAIRADGTALNGLRLRIFRDPAVDIIQLFLFRPALPPGLRAVSLQVFARPRRAEAGIGLDAVPPARLFGHPPAPVQAWLAFWQVFPAVTPAQAQRRWDSAHAGPLGERHGLRSLLTAARRQGIPLTLLDLKEPASLAALTYVDGMSLVQRSIRQGVLHLADSLPAARFGELPGWAARMAAGETRAPGLGLGLPASPILYIPSLSNASALPPGYPILVTHSPVSKADLSQPPRVIPTRWQDRLVLSLPVPPFDQATQSGPSLALIRDLLHVAAGQGPDGDGPLLLLGGPLPESAWGDPQAAAATLRYLRARPWIRFAAPASLLTLRPVRQAALPPSTPPAGLSRKTIERSSAILAALGDLRLVQQQPAWGAYRALLAAQPLAPPSLTALRGAYLGQIEVLLAASRWAAAPYTASDCAIDLDADGQAECLLANDQVFAVFELQGARLDFAFLRSEYGYTQIIGPFSQLAPGLADPSTWDLSGGFPPDPGDLPGAFVDRSGAAAAYTVQVSPGLLAFSGPYIKTFRLLPSGIHAVYQPGPETPKGQLVTRLALLLSPQPAGAVPWSAGYRSSPLGDGYTWCTTTSPGRFPDQETCLEIRTDAPVIRLDSFLDSPASRGSLENPDREVPPGHFIPFPFAIVHIESAAPFQVTLQAR